MFAFVNMATKKCLWTKLTWINSFYFLLQTTSVFLLLFCPIMEPLHDSVRLKISSNSDQKTKTSSAKTHWVCRSMIWTNTHVHANTHTHTHIKDILKRGRSVVGVSWRWLVHTGPSTSNLWCWKTEKMFTMTQREYLKKRLTKCLWF